MREYVQTIKIVLSNGKEGTFTGKYLIAIEEALDLEVKEIYFSPPVLLPEGVELYKIKSEETGTLVH